MCRFSVSNAPAVASSPELALDTLLAEDDFNWYNAIDCLPESELAEFCDFSGHETKEAPAARQEFNAPLTSSTSGASYDLREMFNAGLEQDLATLPANQQAQQLQAYGVAPAQAQPVPQQQTLAGPPACSVPDYNSAALPATSTHSSMASGPMPGCTSAVMPPAAVASGSCVLTTPFMGLVTPSLPMAPCAGSAVLRKPGSRTQRTQADLDAAVERIKQKRRESAQRSRARKNDYMQQLEAENQSLRDEVLRLQNVLAAMQHGACVMQPQLSAVRM